MSPKDKQGDFMKKHLMIFMVTAFMINLSAAVWANSGPVFWRGYPSSEIMSIEKDSPIGVRKENLFFDFSDSDESDYTIRGKVTAAYDMDNPTNEQQPVKMAFPFIGTLDSLSPDDIVITVDDNVLPYEIYLGDVVNSYGNPWQEDKEASFDFSGIVNTITDELYKAQNFAENEIAKLYIIEVKPTTAQRINLAVDFNFDGQKTKVLTKGFNRYERDEYKTRIAAWCYGPEMLEILVLGEDINLRIDAYTDGELREKTDLFTCQISTQEVEFKPYLVEYIKKNTNRKDEGIIADTQLYNLFAKALDKYFMQNRGYSSEHDLLAQENFKRIITLVYKVVFPPHSEKEVSVSYKTSGTMDKTKTVKPQYSFDYILNPAENWSNFENLNIKITTPQKYPFIIKSSIELIREENRVYTAALANLPGNDLSFTLYADEKITILDKVAGKLQNSFGYFTILIIYAAVFLALGIIVVVIFKIR